MHDFKKVSHRGGKRDGAGRPPLGKERFTVTLDAKNAARVKAKVSNFSDLIDKLLSQWLASSKVDSSRTPDTSINPS